MTVRGCVIGAGAISEQHLRWFADRTDVGLDSVVDRSQALAEFAVERFGDRRTLATTDLDRALQRRPDVVHVLTPPATHAALVERSLEAGASVVCEKPLALDADTVARLLADAEHRGVHLVENHNYRFNDATRRLLEAVDRGDLGAVHDVEVRMALDITAPDSRLSEPDLPSPLHALPAGAVHDYLTHLVYLPLAVTGPTEVDDVFARLSNHAGRPGFRFDDLDATVVGRARGRPVHLRIRFEALTGPDRFELVVRGEAGSDTVEFFHGRHRRQRLRRGAGPLGQVVDQAVDGVRGATGAVRNLVSKLRGETAYEGIAVLLDGVYAAVRDGTEPPVTADDVLATARLIDRILVAAGVGTETRS